MGFAPPPYDGFALLASAHTRMRCSASTFPMLAMNAPYTESQTHATRLGGSLCIWTMPCFCIWRRNVRVQSTLTG
jgi:hypothetical protein